MGDILALIPEKSTKKKINIDIETILFKKHRLAAADFFHENIIKISHFL